MDLHIECSFIIRDTKKLSLALVFGTSGNMDDDRKRFLRRRTVGSFSENLSFYPEKDNLSWNHASLDPDEIEKIINIR